MYKNMYVMDQIDCQSPLDYLSEIIVGIISALV